MTLGIYLSSKNPVRITFLLSLCLVMSACNMHINQAHNEGIGYREARFADIFAMRTYRKCRDQALELDRQARKEGVPARYLASARLIEKCEAELGSSAAKVGEDERMHAFALSIQNYFKGGDIAKARSNLEKLKEGFSGKDLYLGDGSSFIETMEVILGVTDGTSIHQFSLANVNSDLKAELRRVHYWKKN